MMKNQYMILALMPILFQSALYCVNSIDQIIMPQLQSSQLLMRSSTILELQPILDALVIFAKKGEALALTAIDQMKSMKAALQKHRTEQYKTTWDDLYWLFGSNPKKVTEEIDPALAKVDKALKTLETNSSNLGYKIAVGTAATLAAVILAVTVWNHLPKKNTAPVYEVPNFNHYFNLARGNDSGHRDESTGKEIYRIEQLCYLYQIFGLQYGAKDDVLSRYHAMLDSPNFTNANDRENLKRSADAILKGYIIDECFTNFTL